MADGHRQVDGTITMQRPGRIHLVIQLSLLTCEMASDGEHFAAAVFQGDEVHKRFVRGTNSAVYQKLDDQSPPSNTKDGNKSEKETVSALSNLRPQHLTDALMIRRLMQRRATSTHKVNTSRKSPIRAPRRRRKLVCCAVIIYSRNFRHLQTTSRVCSGVSGSIA